LKGELVEKPINARMYATNMNSVDKADIRLHMYLPKYHAQNWRSSFFTGLFYQNLNNASCFADSLIEKFSSGKKDNSRTPFVDHLMTLVERWSRKVVPKNKTNFNIDKHILSYDQFDNKKSKLLHEKERINCFVKYLS